MASPCAPTDPAADGAHRVVVLALDRVIPFDLGIAARVFGAAAGPDGEALYEVVTCGIGGAPVRTADDYDLVVHHDESALQTAGTIVIATQEPDDRLRLEGQLAPEVQAALARVPEHVRVLSICTGSFVLGAMGWLDGLPATTHWAYAERFAGTFPAVQVEPDVLFVDNGRVLTSAGGAAGVDLCLHVVRKDHGARVANAVARSLVVPPHRDGGQAQFIEHAVPVVEASSTASTREWALARLREPLDLERLSEHAGMSIRTFTRRFRAEMGVSPNQWVTQQRVDRARQLLETTELPVESVAYEAGFGSATLLRGHLRAAIGVSPQAYRRTFRAPVREGAAA